MMTGARFFRLTPTDTLFFRDGRPYNQDDEGLAHTHSLFPPHPSTLTGALRAAFAFGQGWNGRDAWPAEYLEVLGDGPDMTGGSLRFGPPMLLRERATGKWEPLYPAPLSLIGRQIRRTEADPIGWTDPALLASGPALNSDLGRVRFPAAPVAADASRRKAVSDLWLTPAGMACVLAGKPPPFDETHVVHYEDLWQQEPRVGLELEPGKRTAKAGRLYAPVHVRLASGVALGQAVSGLKPDWHPAPVVPLGGEHRSAWVEEAEPPTDLSQPSAGRRCITLILLSPARVGADWLKPAWRRLVADRVSTWKPGTDSPQASSPAWRAGSSRTARSRRSNGGQRWASSSTIRLSAPSRPAWNGRMPRATP